MHRFLLACSLLLAMAACGDATRDFDKPVEPIGNFKIGHIGVVSPNLQKLLVSRDATEEEWIEEVTDALEARFERYSGDKFYHLGVSVEAYSLPPPVIPGKSAIALNVTVWDDAAQAKLNEEPKQINVIRVVEAKLASNKDSQMNWLAAQAAWSIELWLREMQESDGWFEGSSDTSTSEEASSEPEPLVVVTPEVGDVEAASNSEENGEALPVVVPENVIAITNAAVASPPAASQ